MAATTPNAVLNSISELHWLHKFARNSLSAAQCSACTMGRSGERSIKLSASMQVGVDPGKRAACSTRANEELSRLDGEEQTVMIRQKDYAR